MSSSEWHSDQSIGETALREWAAARDSIAYYLSIYIHAHQTGSTVPPHIEADAIAALDKVPVQRPTRVDRESGE